jgi:hypothetical protein
MISQKFHGKLENNLHLNGLDMAVPDGCFVKTGGHILPIVLARHFLALLNF